MKTKATLKDDIYIENEMKIPIVLIKVHIFFSLNQLKKALQHYLKLFGCLFVNFKMP